MTISNHNARGCQRPSQVPTTHAVPQPPAAQPPAQSPARAPVQPPVQPAACARPSAQAPRKEPNSPMKRSALLLTQETRGRREQALEAALVRLEQALAHGAEQGIEAATRATEEADAFLCPRADAAPEVPAAPVAPVALPAPPAAPSPTMEQFLEPQRVAANAGVNFALGGMLGIVFGLALAPVLGPFAVPAGGAIFLGMLLGGPNWFGARGQ